MQVTPSIVMQGRISLIRRLSRRLSVKSLNSPVPVDVFKGLAFAFLSGLFYSTCISMVKQLKHLHPRQLALYHSIAIFIFSFWGVVKCGANPLGPRNMRFLIFLGGVFDATNVLLNFLAFRYLPFGVAAVIIFSAPVFVTAMARLVLKEPCGFTQTLIQIVIVIGVLLITRIPGKMAIVDVQYTTGYYISGLCAAIFSLVFNSLRFIILRKLKDIHHVVIMFNYGWIAVIIHCVLTFLIGGFKWHDCGTQQWLLIILGVFSYAGQALLIIALQHELASPVSTVRTTADIILGFILQAAIFGHDPDSTSAAGASLVCSSIVFVGLRKFADSLPEYSDLRQKLKWLTV